jgi:replicative DNA helicase
MSNATTPDTWPDGVDPDRPGPPAHLAPADDERAVLAACLVSPRVLDAVLPSVPSGLVFWEPRHGFIWDAIHDCWEDGRAADIRNVAAALRAAGLMGRVDPVYLARLEGDAPAGTLADPMPYLERVLSGYVLRGGDKALIRGRQTIAAPDGGNPAAILDAVALELAAARDLLARRGNAVRVGDVVPQVLAELDDAAQDDDGFGIPLPYRDLARVVNPMRPGQFGIIAGRPGHGKSTVLKDICTHTSFNLGLPSLLVSWEMKRVEITARVMSDQARVLFEHLTRGPLTEQDLVRIGEYRAAFAAAPLIIEDGDDTSIGEIDRLIREHRPAVVCLDYAQLAIPDGPDSERRARVERWTRAIKQLAGKREVPIVAGSQLNRQPEGRRNHRPRLADLRESGSFEQDCDWAVLMHVPSLTEGDGGPRDRAEEAAAAARAGEVDAIVAKQRNGPTDTVPLAARFHYASIADMAR